MTTDRLTFAGTVEADGRRLRGSVVLEGARTFRNGEWVEVDPKALMKADASGIFASWEHDDEKVLAASTNGTLRVERTPQGFTYETEELPNTTYANDALELVRGGWVTGTSFEIEGTRASTSTDPDTGLRVRRFTSIKRLRQVGPVRDPAFTTSTVAAFSKESTDMDEPIVEPTAPVGSAPAAVTFTAPKDEKSDTYRTAEAFARRQDMTGLEAAMENLIAQGLDTAPKQETYAAFSEVYDERKAADASAKERIERFNLAHLLRTGKGPKAPHAESGLYESEDYKHAFRKYLATGERAIMEQFALSIAGDGTQGGFTVPDGFRNILVETQKAYGGIQNAADSITTADGRSLPWATNDDTANTAVIATEGSAAGSAGADLVFDDGSLGAYTYDATGASNLPLLVSKELIQDSAFDLESFIARKLGERLGRKMAVDFATGSGTGEPLGLMSKSADVMTATTTRAASVEHVFQVDAAYRDGGNCRWIMSDTSLIKFWNAVDKQGRPLFQPMAQSGGQDRFAGILAGYPVTVDNGTGDYVAFGDIRRGYIIRYVRGVTIDVDPYTNIKSRQLAFHAWARADATVQDGAAYSVSSYSGVSADTAA